MKKIILFLSILSSSSAALADMPIINENDSNMDCHRWPMNIATTWLNNNHIVDSANIKRTLGEKISSEKIGKGLRNNVFHFIFEDGKGGKHEVITRNIASKEECSISTVEVYIISVKNNDRIGNFKQYYKYAD